MMRERIAPVGAPTAARPRAAGVGRALTWTAGLILAATALSLAGSTALADPAPVVSASAPGRGQPVAVGAPGAHIAPTPGPTSPAPPPSSAAPAASAPTAPASGPTPPAPVRSTPASAGTIPGPAPPPAPAPPPNTPTPAASAAAPPPAASEASPDSLFRTQSSVQLEGGAQYLDGDSTAAKFIDYRDFREPVALGLADLRVRRWDVDAWMRLVDVTEKDAVYTGWIGKPGLFSALLEWSGIPRTLEDQASTLHHTADGNMILLPNAIQNQLQANASGLKKLLKFSTSPVDLWMNRETTRAVASVSPLRGLTVSVEGEDIRREGKVSRSVSTNFFNGADVTEWANPLDDRTRTGTVRAQLVQGRAMVAGYASVSDYSDRVGPVTVDNPLRAVDAEGQAFGNRGAAQFLVSPPLDNQARELGLQAAIDLPWRMRLAGTFTTGRLEAEHDFLPYTSNTAVRADFFYPDLPARTYEGKVDTRSYSAALTGQLLRILSYKLFARGYEFDNKTPAYAFPSYVAGDTRIEVTPRIALPYGWKRDGQGGEVRVRALPDLSFTAGFARETVDRTFREADRTTEDTLRGAADWRPAPWVFFRASYAGSSRTAEHYDPNAYTASFPGGVPQDQLGFARLRRYDVTDRDRKDIDLLAEFHFTETFGLDYSGGYRSDDYKKTEYGLIDDSSRRHVIGWSFAPFRPCAVRIESGNDFLTRRLDARLRNLLFGRPAESKKNDWSDEISEKVHTVSGEWMCAPEDENWDLSVGLEQLTDRHVDDAAFSPGTVADPEHEGRARRYPPTRRELRQTHARARFRLSRVFDLILRATFEEFQESDRTQDVMSGPMGRFDARAFESDYLGVRIGSYSTRIFDLFLGAHW